MINTREVISYGYIGNIEVTQDKNVIHECNINCYNDWHYDVAYEYGCSVQEETIIKGYALGRCHAIRARRLEEYENKLDQLGNCPSGAWGVYYKFN